MQSQVTPRPYLLLAVMVLSGGCAAEPGTDAVAPGTQFDLSWLAGRTVHEPRIVLDSTDTLLLAWREQGENGSDLFLARRVGPGTFDPPVRVNTEAGTVGSYPHDELRPAVAVGDGGLVAVAWGDSRGQVRVAMSTDGGATFGPSLRLEQVEEPAYRGFPAIAYGGEGVLHAVWIDSRFAADMAEEPADLFYATVADGAVVERNLTQDQEATVCGCCRPHLEIVADGSLRALFRNADDDGYRDIFVVSGRAPDLAPPRRVGTPRWKLHGCPMSGPTSVGDRVLWPDGSTGRKILMQATLDGPGRPLFSDEARGDWRARLAPRPVPARDTGRALALLPGQVASRLIAVDGEVPEILADDLPAWASDAVYDGVALRLVGAIDGVLHYETALIDL